MKQTLILLLLLCVYTLYAQEENPRDNSKTLTRKEKKSQFSFGLNAGFPLLYDVEMEVVHSFFGEHLGAYAKYGYYSFGLGQTGISLDGEVNVTGIFDNRLPLISDITTQFADAFAQEVLATTKVQINYTEIGVRYYLNKDYSGFYGGLGVGFLNANFKFLDVPVLSTIGSLIAQEISYDNRILIPQFKIGYRTKKKLYLKVEAGATFFNLPEILV